MAIHVKRAYDPADDRDGLRILVDRLWPRGLAKAEAHVDLWAKEVAPSTALRQWFGHDPARWTEFRTRYRAELATAPLDELKTLVAQGPVTLIYSAHDSEHNQAVVLAEYLQ